MTRNSSIPILGLLWAFLVVGIPSLAVAQPAAPSGLPDGAVGEGPMDNGDPRVVASLLFDKSAVAPGSSVAVGVLLEMDPHWHIYWINSGQAGLPTEVTFSADGLEFSEPLWPAPTHHSEAGGFITTYGYEEQTLLF
ncbi:MAG: hypothetical protein KC561_01920, partial [Myxococcales bacterium]|nr:hypothetical protein [Myxococcales bacterium]